MYPFCFVLLLMVLIGCVREQAPVVVITPTSGAMNDVLAVTVDVPSVLFTATPPTTIQIAPPDATATSWGFQDNARSQHIVQPGESLSAIASAYGTTVDTLAQLNNLADPDLLSVGQVIRLPAPPVAQTDGNQLIPDSRLVRAPGSSVFRVSEFVSQLPGYIRSATDEVDDEILTGVEIVERISLEFSVDARLLLSLLEFRARWLSAPTMSEDRQIYPIQGGPSPDNIDRRGLYRQLAWTANQLNRGYYNWKYGNLSILEFMDGTRLAISPDLNAGTVGIQYFFSLNSTFTEWTTALGDSGLLAIYRQYFSDPWANPIGLLVPDELSQPELSLPFVSGETWFFTGGPHGGWGSGSAWSAVDFAPPDERPDNGAACYVSEHWVIAVANGVIARSGDGTVILDLDGDGDESTGWTILYLHLADVDRVQAGMQVQAGDLIGRPSCDGGVSNATHLHIGRRYNGEWLPADCSNCRNNRPPPFVMSNWVIFALPNQEYQGYMVRDGEQRTAEQGRLTVVNRVSW